jgi:hypothetical protein
MVASANFIHYSGIILMIGGGLATLGWLLFAIFNPNHTRTSEGTWMAFNLLVVFGGAFMAMGLPGFYFAQSEQTGIVGFLVFIIFFIGIAVPYIAVQSIETSTTPNVPPAMRVLVSIGGPSLFIGALFMGILTYTAGVFPKWLAAALILSVILGLLTRLRIFPPLWSRGLIPAVFTTVLALIGFFTYFRIER